MTIVLDKQLQSVLIVVTNTLCSLRLLQNQIKFLRFNAFNVKQRQGERRTPPLLMKFTI